ncbi:hypothetical protein [Dehalococcoides mccartyi]|uniref:Uncharacterized protein n=1 Tax=Dehalococcoides mccartyi TaxID=61435 RepID=A0A142V9N2_9CHLR|nr:hypothetical protein [Dehalococcoides mccartyi]AMU85975.1 hypothetical protein Dm11a5_0144 [Dehalococcoides mccartyi]
MSKLKLLPIIIEVVGVAVVGTGIGVELATHADIGWATVTIGSCLVAIGGVIWGKFVKGGRL